MQVTKFKETNFQHDLLIPYFTQPFSQGGLNWMSGKESQVDKAHGIWVVPEDLIAFLQRGNPRNARSYQSLQAEKKYKNDHAFYLDCMLSLQTVLAKEPNVAFVMQKNVTIGGYQFDLYNHAPLVLDHADVALHFQANRYRVVPEVTYVQKAQDGRSIERRPDLVFFVNGLYYSYSELKTKQTKQSAKEEGRLKIATNLFDVVAFSVSEVRTAYEKKHGSWPGYRQLTTEFKNIIDMKSFLFSKAVHITTVDMNSLYSLNNIEPIYMEIDEYLSNATGSPEKVKEHSRIIKKIIDAFQKAPTLHGMDSSFDEVKRHLEILYHPVHGVDRDINYFNYTYNLRYSKLRERMSVRAPQRTMFFHGVTRVLELYQNEHIAKMDEKRIRNVLVQDLPTLDPKKVDEIVKDSMVYQNGKDTFSVLLQGAAGVGKTHVMLWSARALFEAIHPQSTGHEALFDNVILLVDRTELRSNLSQEAMRMKGANKNFVEADTFEALKNALKTRSVIIVNIQKLPSIVKHLNQAGNSKFQKQMANKRVAFLIDEIHRSQTGVYHDAALSMFDSLSQTKVPTPLKASRIKRNLIMGFTATPRDEVLARWGEWRAPKSIGDNISWVPYYSYSVQQAINDGYVLDPTKNVLPFQDIYSYDYVNSVQSSNGAELRDISNQDWYQNPDRIELNAVQIMKLFTSTTMFSGRRPNVNEFGNGKAMVVAYDIPSAIRYKEALERVKANFIADPQYAEYKERLKTTPILILYSDSQAYPKCSSLNDRKNEAKVIEEFQRKNADQRSESKNAIIIVVDKLLTGFDEPTLHTLFIDRTFDDVLLLQAMYRVGRIAKNKLGCLVVDFSRDNIVSKRIKPVFEKYAGMTVSDFDAKPLKEKMETSYSYIFNKKMKALYTTWEALYKDKGQHKAGVYLSNELQKKIKAEEETAKTWQKMLSMWLSTSQTLHCILDFNQPLMTCHFESSRRVFARQLLDELNTQFHVDVDVEYPIFQIERVELVNPEDAGLQLPDIGNKKKKESEEQQKSSKGYVSPAIADVDSEPDVLDFLDKLEARAKQNETNAERFRNILQVLFEEVKAAGTADRNFFVKLIQARAQGQDNTSHEERERLFHQLLNKAFKSTRLQRIASSMLWTRLLEIKLKLLADYEIWVLNGEKF